MDQLNCSNTVLPEYIAAGAVMGLCFVLGVPGNIAALVILIRRLKNNSMTTRLMLSLTVADLLTLLTLPFWIWDLLHGWTFGSVACKLLGYVSYCCIYSSVCSVTVLSIQRYIQILHPQKWAKLGARAREGVLCGIWVVSGVLTLYAPVQREVGCEKGQMLSCNQYYNNDNEKVAIASMETLIILLFLFLLVYFYYFLHRGVNEMPFFSSNKLTNLVTRIVVTSFIFTFGLPITRILIIIAVVIKSESLSKTADIGDTVAKALMIINSCLNPFLYSFSLRNQHHNS